MLKNKKIINILTICIIGIASVLIRMPENESMNYINGDATWHAILTIQAYEETPANVHKFLPIVTLGEDGDKNITWGATLPDEFGNYYYTSFSSLGYVVPYAFNKIFNLPNTEQSLYLFNSVLYILSFVILALTMCKIFAQELPELAIIVVSALYLFQVEVMHSQGIGYWHQSLFQMLFLMQLFAYLNMNKRLYKFGFFILCLILPYLEWTGYVTNFAFFIVFICNEFKFYKGENKTQLKTQIKNAAVVVLMTIASLLAFIFHFISVLDAKSFFITMKQRFFSRAHEQESAIFKDLFIGYWASFKYLLIFIIFLAIVVIILRVSFKDIKAVLIKNKVILFVGLFAMIENFIMLQHAIQYTFDRLKFAIPLITVAIMLVSLIYSKLKEEKFKKIYMYAIITICIALSATGLYNYSVLNTGYLFEANYLKDNKVMAAEIREHYNEGNSVMFTQGFVRGYINMLFERGVYEGSNVEFATQIAKERNVPYVIELHGKGHNFNGYTVYVVD